MEKLIKELEEIQKGFLAMAQGDREKRPRQSYQEFMLAETCRKAIRELDKRNPKQMELEGGGSTWWYVCPECRRAIDENDKFCRECGQAVKRE